MDVEPTNYEENNIKIQLKVGPDFVFTTDKMDMNQYALSLSPSLSSLCCMSLSPCVRSPSTTRRWNNFTHTVTETASMCGISLFVVCESLLFDCELSAHFCVDTEAPITQKCNRNPYPCG
jgi:hypothetical protein